MVIRAVARDILGIYLGYEIIKGYIQHNFAINTFILLAAAILLIFGVWFLLERTGIIPKIT